MSKVTLTDLANLQNETTAVNAINSNNSAVEAAFDNTLSRDGTAPNQMSAPLDMNSNAILNLPLPVSNYEPLRVIDGATIRAGGTIAVNPLPSGGTTGQVLSKNSATNFDTSWTTITNGLTSYSAPYTGSTPRTIINKLSDVISVLDFGVDNTGVTDCSTQLQTAINNASYVFLPPGSYKVSTDILVPSNRVIWVQKGATVTTTGGRWTSYLPGGGNVHYIIDGVMAFAATASAPQLPGWFGNAAIPDRGLIEFGGNNPGNPATHFSVTGKGRIYSDYVWTGVPSGFFDLAYQLNRKGINFQNTSHVLVDGIEISNVYGECIYWCGYGGGENIRFVNNFVHEVAFNGLNFNVIGHCLGSYIQNNTIINSMQAIEASMGIIDGNYIFNTGNGIITGAGGGGGPLRITNNTIHTTQSYGISVSFSGAPIEDVMIMGNQLNGPGGPGIECSNISAFLISDNLIYTWANTISGAGILVDALCGSGMINGNVLRAPGIHSTGNVVNSGVVVTVGTNAVV